MKVLIVGGGGREHALAWRIAASPLCTKLYAAPGNPGIGQFAHCVNIPAEDVEALAKFAIGEKIDLTVVGPEDALAGGLVDKLDAAGLKAFGPTAAAAQLESDKAFAKHLMRQHAIPTAEARVFDDFLKAEEYVLSRTEPLVVKASGLAKGKGAYVCDNPEQALDALAEIMKKRVHGEAGDRVVIEQRLSGPEVSLLAFVDGRTIYTMETAQDHKAIGDGDSGPNTGGMGAYCPAPVATDAIISQVEREVLVPTVDALRRSGRPYKGVLYAGLMLTAGGPRVLEFNCRFGDPETQPILMRLQSDLLEVLWAVANGTLEDVTLKWDPRPAVCVVMSSGGYPGSYKKGLPITGIEAAEADGDDGDVKVFHAGTARSGGKLVTAGGRVLGVTALGETIAAAKKRAYAAVSKIAFEGAYCRHDIADKAIK
ncbi:MAG: phosphoribosylamine--glycine ligase [Phycisphaerae bacterium]|nr:phosphoribosylamine--glycine ligase [Phycisphaerae bacterium]